MSVVCDHAGYPGCRLSCEHRLPHEVKNICIRYIGTTIVPCDDRVVRCIYDDSLHVQCVHVSGERSKKVMFEGTFEGTIQSEPQLVEDVPTLARQVEVCLLGEIEAMEDAINMLVKALHDVLVGGDEPPVNDPVCEGTEGLSPLGISIQTLTRHSRKNRERICGIIQRLQV